MQPKPSQPEAGQANAEPLAEIIEDLVPAALHAAAWEICSGKGWYFGHGSNTGGWARFWKMDLEGIDAFNAIWEHVRPRCEALAGTSLRVVRQYANGHTYGLGGEPHLDDPRPGTYTLLYYPNPEWKDGWDGETVFYDQAGEIALSVCLRPNRAVFFDSRIRHKGRAPSRQCTAVRVSVAYKLEAVSASGGSAPKPPRIVGPKTDSPQVAATESPGVVEAERDGAKRVYRARVPAAEIQRAVDERLTQLTESVRLPGFRPGKIPRAAMEERYGAQSRALVMKRLAADLAQRGLPAGSVASSCELLAGAESGDLEISIAATHLPDLPDVDFSKVTIEAIKLAEPDTSAETAVFLRERLKSQVLDSLDTAFAIPLFPGLIEREFSAIWKLAEARGGLPAAPEERRPLEADFRKIAERRLRLGVVLAELARRLGIRAAHIAAVEDSVIDHLLSQARVEERLVSTQELRSLMAG